MPFVLFDIETRIDKALLRDALFTATEELQATDLLEPDKRAELAYQAAVKELSEKQGVPNPFFPVPYHVPISIAAAGVMDDYSLKKVETIAGDSEIDILCNFWGRAERFNGTFVTYNGRAFDFPVLELAAFRQSIPIPNYFSSEVRHRYRDRHLDLHDFLSNYGAVRNLRGGLSLLSVMVGLPDKGEVDGSKVQEMFEAGRLEDIHRYCRNDVRRLYAVFLQVQLMRGLLSPEIYTRIVTENPVVLE